VLERACALDPNERFDSAQDFADAFEASTGHDLFSAPEAAAPSKNPIWKRWNWEVVAIAIVVLLLFLYLIFALKK